jgi:methionine-rich copper-binding protein CopC
MNKIGTIALSLALACWATSVSAHAKLQSSTPADKAQLGEPPASLTLNFSEAAKLAVLRLTAAGGVVPVKVDRDAKASTSVVIALPPLKPGTYDVQWTALAQDDGHVTKGSFSFTVATS